ncbi:arylsulfatase A-like enzyme [Catalinimonas alkaloidigena]|uniref:sulfatase family protein n=1 Tax=Catalinimonas alkaloidigena TaxID=1075417 RepID=UPI002405EC10|nr:arylsulfatase [Catalinimonas alkaloidigena]MDF9796468.1 arylsulfatase A-like enzyme [Catalinimonas alkaloidigena]
MLRKTYIIFSFILISGISIAQKLPNVIVVLADDIGSGDLSYYRRMHSQEVALETPHLDALAKSGMAFTNAHSPAALCAPSRYAIMTGNSCYRSPSPWGVWSAYAKSPIQKDQLTLGRLMKQANYHTAFLGKWHLGGRYYRKGSNELLYEPVGKDPQLDVDISKIVDDGPQQMGFDYSITLPAGIQNVPYAVYENGEWMPLEDSRIDLITHESMTKINASLDKSEGLGDANWDPHIMGPLLAGKAVNYISTHANQSQPFFMYYCSQAVHLPHTPPAELNGVKIAGTTPSAHMDMIRELDEQIGMMIAELKKRGVYENTIFIFTSDNGGLHVDKKTLASGHKPNSIYRGSKNTPYEGGHRVPFIISWPAQIKAEQQSSQTVLGLDIMATLAAISGQKIEEGQAMDSYNLLPILKNDINAETHPYLMVQGGSHREVMIIENGWKLIIQVDKKDKSDQTRTPVALFNLNDNLIEDERYNLINNNKYMKKVEALFDKYNSTRESKVFTGNHL